MRRHLVFLVTTTAIVLSACASSAVSDSEFDGVVAERDALAADLAERESELAVATEAFGTLSSDQADSEESAESEIGRLTAETESLTENLAAAEEATASATEDAAAAREEADALLLKYDPEIRSELEAEVAAEIVRACVQAEEEYDRSVSTIVNWSVSWDAVTTRGELTNNVEDCAADERTKTADQREDERLAACETVDVDALEKNPDKYRGECVRMWAYIVQYDSNTGICRFRAELSPTKTSRWYNYDGNAFFSSKTDPVCPELDEIDNSDFVEIWATGNGILNYDTQAGGTATATIWIIEKIDLWRKG